MISKKHSKLCLRRMSSRATLESTEHHSKLCMRNRVRRVRNRLQIHFHNLKRRSQRQDYFIGRLPPEIRVMIYTYALCFDTPIVLVRDPNLAPKNKLAGILLVNRLVYNEALPLLHELNTIVVSREELCQFSSGKQPQLNCKLEVVQSLYIRHMDPSSRCAARISCPWPATNQPCQNCRPSILGLIQSLRLLRLRSKLKEVFIEYHGYHYAISALLRELRASDDLKGETELTCTGIGKYMLTGSWLANMTFSFRDVPLAEVWSRVTALPLPHTALAYYRAQRAMWKELAWLESRTSAKTVITLAMRTLILLSYHDANLVPSTFASIWPRDLPMDFRTLESVGTPELLHKFNVQLHEYMDAGPVNIQEMVRRR